MKRTPKIPLAIILALLLGSIVSCRQAAETDALIIFHAGSLSVPFREITQKYQELYPGVEVQVEIAGSVTCARKITELNKECDVLASADYRVIDELLIPEHASWNIPFAANEMVLAYRHEAPFSGRIDSTNWHRILEREEVVYGRSDPNADPCGYRTLQVLQLAEQYYHRPGLSERLIRKDQTSIRPKETDLIALLETSAIDYLFIYRSVARQHELPYLALPDQVNLGNPDLNETYQHALVEIRGNTPGSTISLPGTAMVYGVTIPGRAPHRDNAVDFLSLLLGSKGQEILAANGQKGLVPAPAGSWESLPEELRPFALPE